ncbi:MAG: peptide chain release factor N(5)-glutamine methyltransferase [Candidatus Hydrogenedens sp.]|nr:peptide chain release factor N(5)-glutamine methyltransferase [Candidatus Hydrogenedentota bacterium]NLF56956.1 peptide chain release factor N(5)-glutamine methyltransferase [Candidatus Hydrogenedens sp.]
MDAPLGDILRDAARQLAAVSESPRLDAELLLAHALGGTRSGLLSRLGDTVPCAAFPPLLARRMAHEPVAYILGTQEFFSLIFIVRPPMLIPRPETEHLVEAALARLANRPGGAPPARILDLCTGTGCVAVTLARHAPNTEVTATDLNPDAAALARENAALNNVPLRVLEGDLFAALPPNEPPFDAVLANPPYVETAEWDRLMPDIRLYEDPAALLAGEDGLDLIRRIIAEAPAHLAPGGLLALEIGETQYPAVAELLAAHGFRDIRAVKDLAGMDRIAVALRG